jgi:hypothetical protein
MTTIDAATASASRLDLYIDLLDLDPSYEGDPEGTLARMSREGLIAAVLALRPAAFGRGLCPARFLGDQDIIRHRDLEVCISAPRPTYPISAGQGKYLPAVVIDWVDPGSVLSDGTHARLGAFAVPLSREIWRVRRHRIRLAGLTGSPR